MDSKILILLLLCASLLAFGCAGKKAQQPGPVQGNTIQPSGAQEGTNGTMGAPETGEDESMPATGDMNGADSDLSDLADLFVVDTDKPLEGEGLDIEGPKSNKS